MMNSRSFTTLLLGNLFLIALILGLGFWQISHEMNRQSTEISKRFQRQLLDLIQNDLEESWMNADNIIAQYCRSYSKMPEFRLTVIDHEGRVLGDSVYPVEKMEPHNTEKHPEVLAALAGQPMESSRLSRTIQIRYRYLAVPVRFDGKIVAVVRIAFPVTDLLEDRRHLVYGIWAGFVTMFFVVAVLSALLNWIWYQPLRLISSSARRIAEGKFEPIPNFLASCELGQLINALNRMQNTVSVQIETISRQRERLQIILHHLPDAVFALNSLDQIVYYNEAAREIFELDSPGEPVPIQHLLRYSPILDFYFQEREKNFRTVKPEQIGMNIRNRKRSLELEIIDIPGGDDRNEIAILLIVNDLTLIAETNRIKTDFVANTSHELRTPLTAIRATLDNIADGVCGDPQSFRSVFEILDRHVARLEALTNDLLSLHDVEQETIANLLEMTTFNEQKIRLEEIFRTKAMAKKIHLFIESDTPEKSFSTDEKRLGLVLQNLLDNAVKFTPEGGSVKLVFSFENDRMLAIRCEDTGCGIAPEEQSRIFERFYRIKSRDRVPGTGLGLAIVKHAVERLGGTLTLDSRIDQGSTFTVRIPLNLTD